MKQLPLSLCLIIFFANLCLTSTTTFANNKKASGTTPSPRTTDYPWMSVDVWNKMYADDIAIADKGGIDLLFIGDSITAGWNLAIWEKNFTQYHPANFGIGGDHTGNVLWRLQHGHANKLKPKLVILLIGINNFGHLDETPEQVFAGITAVTKNLRKTYPNSKILVNGIFPAEESAQNPTRALIIAANKMIATLADNNHIFVKDYGGSIFLQKDGSISKKILGDFLHPTEIGYQLWAEAMLPDIQQLMR